MNCASKIVDACGGPDDAIPHVQAILDELVAAERERCADVARSLREDWMSYHGAYTAYDSGRVTALLNVEDAIRAAK